MKQKNIKRMKQIVAWLLLFVMAVTSQNMSVSAMELPEKSIQDDKGDELLQMAGEDMSNYSSHVSMGDFHSSVITENGDLYCWGYNDDGEVGNGTTEDQLTPIKVLRNVVSISQGIMGTNGAITENGDLYCWGYNDDGEVGNGTTKNQLTPVKILSNVISVSMRKLGGGAITENGDLYCWGYNVYGEVGNGTTENQLTPVKVLSNVVSISMDNNSSSAITENGDLYCWGCNYDGEVGNGTTEDQLTPVKVLSNVVSISMDSDSSSAITANGDLYCWGDNYNGEVGNGTTEDQLMPVKVLSNVVSVSEYSATSGVITENGDLYCWGNNNKGQVGNGTTQNQLTPVKVLSNVVVASTNGFFNSAITKNGDLYCWGYNDYGQVGNGTTENQLTPVKVLSDVIPVLNMDGYVNSAITANGDLYRWGRNYNGEVGNGTTKNQLMPVKVLSNVVSVAERYRAVGAITANGDLYCWGYNDYGQVGNGTTEDQLKPVKIMNLNSMEESVDDLLRSYASQYTYLGDSGKKYIGYIEKTGGWFSYKADVPINPISFRIDDFDMDGQNELLIVTIGEDYRTILEVYEVEDGKVVKKDSTDFKTEYGSQIKSGLKFEEGSFNCMTFSQNKKKIIALEEFVQLFVGGDGVGWKFVTTEYKDGKFDNVKSVEFGGSDWEEDSVKEFEKKLESMGVSANGADIVSKKSNISDHIMDNTIFASVKNQPRSYDWEYYKDVTDRKEFSDITFVKQNTEGCPIVDPSPKPPENIEENTIVYFEDTKANENNNRKKITFDYSIESCLENDPSQYNPDLAHMLAALADSAYQKEGSDFTLLKNAEGRFPDNPLVITQSLRNLGFHAEEGDVCEYNYYPWSDDAYYNKDTTAFTLAEKELSDGTKLILIVVRGSFGELGLDIWNLSNDWKSNVNFKNQGVALHEGFNTAAEEIMRKLNEFKNRHSISGDKVKYVLTGHSRGAAVANLVAKKLIDNVVSENNVYDYNFACPDSGRDYPDAWNPNGKYDGLFNINNADDFVGYIPGYLFNASLNKNGFFSFNESGILSWWKYGRTYFFADNWKGVQTPRISAKQHAIHLYLEQMGNKQTIDAFKSVEQVRKAMVENTLESRGRNGKVFCLFCPVDLEVADQDGNKIAAVVNGETTYYSESFGNVVIITAGDQSLVYVNGDRDYIVKFVGSDSGVMTYCVSDAILGTEYGKEIIYTNVPISQGKTMISKLGNNVSADETTLVVVDKELHPLKQIGYDGREQELSEKLKEEYSDLPIGKTEKQYKITYKLDGGQMTGNPVTYNKDTDTFTLKNPVKSGYTFIGWTGSNGNTPEMTVAVNKGTIGDLSYIANWTEERVKDVNSITRAEVTLSQSNYIYDGSAKKPSVTVNLNGKTLRYNTDYIVAYSNNIDAGTAKVIIVGKGSYTGIKTVKFTIEKAAGQAETSITCKKTLYEVVYGVKPFKINASSKGTLTFTSDHPKTVSVDKKSGKATVKRTGIAVITIKSGNHSTKVTVKVSPGKQSLKSVKAANGRKLTVKWAKDKNATGYQVQICTDKNFRKPVKQRNVPKNTYVVTKLKAGKKYYVRVRSYKKSGNVILYGAWSKGKKSEKVKR